MYKAVAEKYENLTYNKETLNMILDILEEDKNTYRILEALVIDLRKKKKENEKNKKTNEVIGLTKSIMYKTIKIDKTSKASKDISDESNAKGQYITRKYAENAINLLLGAGLICYDIKSKEIYYSLTVRGTQVCVLLKQNKLINIE